MTKSEIADLKEFIQSTVSQSGKQLEDRLIERMDGKFIASSDRLELKFDLLERKIDNLETEMVEGFNKLIDSINLIRTNMQKNQREAEKRLTDLGLSI